MGMSIYKSGHEGLAAYINDSGAAMSEVSSSHLSYPIALYQDTHFAFCLGSRPENHGGINEENTVHAPPRLGFHALVAAILRTSSQARYLVALSLTEHSRTKRLS